MGQVKSTFDGGVVAEPELKQVGGNAVLEFPVYVNHRKKNADTGEYEDSGDVTKIRVALWRDLAQTDIRKGDIVEVIGTLVEKEFTRKDGTEGRAMQTQFVDSVTVKFRKDDAGGGRAADAYSAAGAYGNDSTPPGF